MWALEQHPQLTAGSQKGSLISSDYKLPSQSLAKAITFWMPPLGSSISQSKSLQHCGLAPTQEYTQGLSEQGERYVLVPRPRAEQHRGGPGLPGGGAPFLDPWISPCVEPLWISNISGEPHFGFGSVRANWSKLGKKPALKSQKTVLGFQWNHKIQCQPLYLWVGYFNLTHREHFCGMFSILRDDSCSRAPHGRPVLFYEVLCCDWQSWKGHNV